MKFKVGDKVRVRKDLSLTKQYAMDDGSSIICTTTSMRELGGQIGTIKSIVDGRYHLDIDKNGFVWTDGMLEDVGIFKVGDVIVGTETGNREYTFTTDRAVMKVISVLRNEPKDGYDDIEVKIIEHKDYKSEIGCEYEVESKYFKLVKESEEKVMEGFVKTIKMNGKEIKVFGEDNHDEIEEALQNQFEDHGEFYEKVFGISLEAADSAGWHPRDNEFDKTCVGFEKFLNDEGKIHTPKDGKTFEDIKEYFEKEMF